MLQVTRYPTVNKKLVLPIQVAGLIDSDNPQMVRSSELDYTEANTGNRTEGAMVCNSLGSLLRPLFYFLCYIHFSLSVG